METAGPLVKLEENVQWAGQAHSEVGTGALSNSATASERGCKWSNQLEASYGSVHARKKKYRCIFITAKLIVTRSRDLQPSLGPREAKKVVHVGANRAKTPRQKRGSTRESLSAGHLWSESRAGQIQNGRRSGAHGPTTLFGRSNSPPANLPDSRSCQRLIGETSPPPASCGQVVRSTKNVAGDWTVSILPLYKMATQAVAQAQWEKYMSKRETKMSSVDRLTRTNPTEKRVRGQVLKCKTDFTSALKSLKDGTIFWTEDAGGLARSMKNYMTYQDAADSVNDKLEYLRSLLDQYIGARSEAQEDEDYQVGFQTYIGDNSKIANDAVAAWEAATTAFVEQHNAVKVVEIIDNEVNNVNNANEGEETVEKTKYKRS